METCKKGQSIYTTSKNTFNRHGECQLQKWSFLIRCSDLQLPIYELHAAPLANVIATFAIQPSQYTSTSLPPTAYPSTATEISFSVKRIVAGSPVSQKQAKPNSLKNACNSPNGNRIKRALFRENLRDELQPPWSALNSLKNRATP